MARRFSNRAHAKKVVEYKINPNHKIFIYRLPPETYVLLNRYLEPTPKEIDPRCQFKYFYRGHTYCKKHIAFLRIMYLDGRNSIVRNTPLDRFRNNDDSAIQVWVNHCHQTGYLHIPPDHHVPVNQKQQGQLVYPDYSPPDAQVIPTGRDRPKAGQNRF